MRLKQKLTYKFQVHIYHNLINHTGRVEGKTLEDDEVNKKRMDKKKIKSIFQVVLNCRISKGLEYEHSKPTFYEWKDNQQSYGLVFTTKDDADVFAAAITKLWQNEESIAEAIAKVEVYDDLIKKMVTAGSSPGFSKV